MKRTVWVLTLLLSACALASAQQPPKTIYCPDLVVVGPSGIVPPGQLATYTASVAVTQSSSLKYEWTVDEGTIESGQGTPTIHVRIADNGHCPTATVKVMGLDSGCASFASETSCADPGPSPEKLDQFFWPLDSTIPGRVKALEETVSNNPYAQLYVILPPDAKIRSEVIRAFWPILRERNLEPARVTLVELPSKNNVIQVWLVPPGATPPSKCEGCEPPVTPAVPTPAPANCPTIEVTGPSGVTARGTIMPFVVLVSEPRLKNLSFAWTVSTGTIAEGQGTRVIKVRAPAANGTKNLVATVTVQGLPQGCRNVASDTAEIAFTGGRRVGGVYAFVK